MKKIKEEWLKKFSSLMQKLEGDGPMWFWNGDKQIYLRNCDEDVWQFIESSPLSQKKDLKEMVEGSRKYRFVGQGRDNFIKEKDILEKL